MQDTTATADGRAFDIPVKRHARRIDGDRIFQVLVAAAAGIVLVGLGAAALSMLFGGLPAFEKFGFGFLYRSVWDPVRQDFGAFVPIYGTLVTALLSMMVAVPVSFGIAVFLTEVAPAWLRGPVGRGDRIAGRHPQHHLRHVGTVRVRPVHVRLDRTVGFEAYWQAARARVRCSPGRRWASAC